MKLSEESRAGTDRTTRREATGSVKENKRATYLLYGVLQVDRAGTAIRGE